MSDDGRIGIEIRGFYDGVSVWIEPDGTITNRWTGVPGWESLAARVDGWIERNREALEREYGHKAGA